MRLAILSLPPLLMAFAAPPQDAPQTAQHPRPSILIFSKGFACAHCAEQYQAYAKLLPQLKRYGVSVTFVLPKGEAPPTGSRLAKETPIAVTVDTDQALSRKYARALNGADHGTFVRAPGGKVAWGKTGKAPFTDVAIVLAAAVRTEVRVEIEINNTPTSTDDYLTWAPTPARIKVTKSPEKLKSITVVLTNDAEKPIPAGREQPLDGNLVFARPVKPGTTADQPTLTLTLPTDGKWVDFAIAGQFPRASSADKDAVVEVHLDKADGPLIGSHAMMVRVRKNIDKLTREEQVAFLKALRDLHVRRKGFELFPRIHDLAARGKIPYQQPFIDGKPNPNYWPDQAHGGSAFLPWHRAFLLQFERELQKINPAVTIPYWRQNVKTNAFNPAFLGTNRSPFDDVFRSEVHFSPANWLYGWNISYRDLKTVIRAAKDHSLLRIGEGPALNGDTELFKPDNPLWPEFGTFHGMLETNPHNIGHSRLGGWHNNCLISPSDPSFWPFHAEDDRLWAKWQWFHDRFDADGTDGQKSYDFVEKFRPNEPKVTTLGHNLKDTMWPWDGTKGVVQEDKELKGNRPTENPFDPFLGAPWAGLWPKGNAKPKPADMIDYLGMSGKRLPHGVCYDDVPYGVRRSVAPPPAAMDRETADLLAEIAEDASTPINRRKKALHLLRASPAASERALNAVAKDRTAPVALRQDALIGLMALRPKTAIDRLADTTREKGERGRRFRAALVEIASAAHLAPLPAAQGERLHKLLTETMGDEDDPPLAARAAVALAAMNDPDAVKHLRGLLKVKGKPPIPRAEIAVALPPGDRQTQVSVREVLEKALKDNDEETALVALRILAGDADSRKRRVELIDADPSLVGWSVKRFALRSVMRESPETLPKALSLLEGTLRNDHQLKLEAAGAFRVALESQGPFKPEQLKDWKDRVTKVHTNVPDSAAEMKLALAMALETLAEVGTKK